MCGRFSLAPREIEHIRTRFSIEGPLPDMTPRYNIAPNQPCLIIVRNHHAQMMNWGFHTRWSPLVINARAETAASKPTFKALMKSQRCLIPADGFFEWKREGNKKTPMRICKKDGDLFAFAGLWHTEEDKNSFVILTTEANALVASIHNRMPVILRPEDEEMWLGADPSEAKECLKSYQGNDLKTYKVSAAVNSWKNNTQKCIEAV